MKLRIIQDPYPMNPMDWDGLGTICTTSNRYLQGHETFDSIADFAEHLGVDVETEERDSIEGMIREKYILLRVYMYVHGGIALSTAPFSCPWDSGHVGYIYLSREIMEKEGMDETEAEKYMQVEIETLNQYLNGDVYGFIVEEDGNEIDSCYGFYGSDWNENGLADHLPEEALPLLDEVEIEYQ